MAHLPKDIFGGLPASEELLERIRFPPVRLKLDHKQASVMLPAWTSLPDSQAELSQRRLMVIGKLFEAECAGANLRFQPFAPGDEALGERRTPS